jgi:hypothetical protein
MMRRTAFVLTLLAPLSLACGDTYRVTNISNGGTGSLRWAIRQANDHAGRDKIVFRTGLSGSVILPTTALPAVRDARTIIDGDIDDDGEPDIAVNGRGLAEGSGLVVRARRCVIEGLAITNFPGYGIDLNQVAYCTVRSCHLGVNLAGTRVAANGLDQLAIYAGGHNLVGGTDPGDGNIIAGGPIDPPTAGIGIGCSHDNRIVGNTIGLNRAGTAALEGGWMGIRVFRGVRVRRLESAGQASAVSTDLETPAATCADDNIIGGTTPAEKNVIGGVPTGIKISGVGNTTVSGNTFGLARNGNTAISCQATGVWLSQSPTNTIGGTAAGARNVFGGSGIGVHIDGPQSLRNRVQGNYFGTNVAGTQQRETVCGVYVTGDAGRQIIGGNTERAGNYFTAQSANPTMGVALMEAGAGSTIRNNTFGVLPAGSDATRMRFGIILTNVAAEVTDNEIARARTGLRVTEAAANARVFGNLFRRCPTGVSIDTDGRCLLGDLNNATPGDDGGNTFRPSNACHIENLTPFAVKAEGNAFGTTSRAAINAKITDRQDNPAYGRVDFSPLAGGVTPTGETSILALTSVTGIPTPAGAQVSFSLSAPAQVQARIMSIAGRPVRILCAARECEAGANTLLWNAQGDNGLPVPNGAYLVELLAQGEDGAQTRALTQVRVAR